MRFFYFGNLETTLYFQQEFEMGTPPTLYTLPLFIVGTLPENLFDFICHFIEIMR